MSMVGNLRELEENGVEAFLKSQEAKHNCPECGDVISVHDQKCYACGFVEQSLKKRREE
jgi:ribosomal protein L37E